MLENIFEFILFQLEFWLALFSGKTIISMPFQAYFYWIVIIITLADFFRRKPNKQNITLLMALTFLGIINDSVLIHLNVFIFPIEKTHIIGISNLFDTAYNITIIPFWLMSLWLCLGVWFVQASWMNTRYLMTSTLFAIGAPLSYLTGLKMGLFQFSLSEINTLIIISINWILLGIFMVCLKRLSIQTSRSIQK